VIRQSFLVLLLLFSRYATFGPPLHVSPQPPVLFLHGGHLSSRWFSHQLAHVSLLSSPYTSIALDTRGHGRSTSSLLEPLSYSLLAQDVIALFNHLDIPKVSVVGWSDGGCTALALAMKHSTRVDRVFAFGANYNPDNGDYESIANSTTFPEVYARVMPEYKEINPKGDYEKLAAQLKHMQASLNWNRQDFAAIPTSESVGEKGKGNWPLVWIAQGDREEAIKREAAVQMHDWVRSPVKLPCRFQHSCDSDFGKRTCYIAPCWSFCVSTKLSTI